MQVTIQELTGQMIGIYEIHRYTEHEQMLLCALTGGYCQTIPKKNTAYTITVDDPDNQIQISKIAMFNSYSFVADKNGDEPAMIADNSFVFTMLG